MRLATKALPIFVVIAGAAACGGTSSPPAVANGTPSSAVSAAPTSTAAGAHTPAAAPRASTSNQPVVPPAPPVGTSTATTAASVSASNAPAPSSSSAPLPPAGNYTYQVKGHADSALGSQSLDGTSTLTVDAAQGDSQHSTQKDKGGTTEQTVVTRPAGLFLADIKMSQQGFNQEFRPSAPVLLYPMDAKPGRSWHWRTTSTDGKYTLDASLKVGRPRTVVSASGQRVSTVTVSSVLVITGDSISMTIHQVDQASKDGLIVREHAVADGTAYGTKFHSDSTRSLQSKAR